MKGIKYNYEKINMVEINDVIFPHKETHYTLSRKRSKFKKIDKGLFSYTLKKYLDGKPSRKNRRMKSTRKVKLPQNKNTDSNKKSEIIKTVETNKPKSYLDRLKLWFSNLKNKF